MLNFKILLSNKWNSFCLCIFRFIFSFNLRTSPQHPKAILSCVLKEKNSTTLLKKEYLKPHAEGQGVHMAGEVHFAFVHSNRAVRGHTVLLECEHLQSQRPSC